MLAFFGPNELYIFVIPGLLLAIPFWRICRRVGFPAWLGLLGLFPPALLVLIWVLAFAEWPGESREPASE